MPEIIKDGAVVADDWTLFRLTDGESASEVTLPEGKVIVPLAVWHARRDQLTQRGNFGVWLSDTDAPESIEGDLSSFSLVAVDFPKFANGRGYSTAALLRTRFGYQGELRAIGDVLRDQIFYLSRVGFNSFAVRPDRSVADALQSLLDYSVTYQGSSDRADPLFRRTTRH